MRAIKIDAEHRSVEEIEFDGDYKAIQQEIGCGVFTIVRNLPEGDDLFVDDEGLLTCTDDTVFFTTPWYPTPLAGSGLVLGSTPDGDSADAKGSLNLWKENVRFMGRRAAWLQEELRGSGWPRVTVMAFDVPEVPTDEGSASDE